MKTLAFSSDDLATCAASVAAAAPFLADQPTEAQNWTILGLLSIVVLGIGRWVVRAIEKAGDATTVAIKESTAAQAQAATQIALLVTQVSDMRREGESSRKEILDQLAGLAERHRP